MRVPTCTDPIEPGRRSGRPVRTACVLAAVAAAGLVPIPALAQTAFGPGPSQTLGATAVDLALGDLDGDGDLDQVVSLDGVAEVAVLLGDGAGAYAPPVRYAASTGGQLAVSDLDGDGADDVVVTQPKTQLVSVLLATGNGGLGAPKPYRTGSEVTAVAAADLDGDGRMDVVVGSAPGATVAVLLGRGDGSLAPALVSASGRVDGSLGVGDLDGDGRLDVVVADRPGDRVRFLRGLGNGRFAAPVVALQVDGPNGVRLVDMDQDGRLDLVGPELRGPFAAAKLTVALGNGSGGFATARSTELDAGFQDIGLADVDGDGRPDVVLVLGKDPSYAAPSVDLRYNRGQGVLADAVPITDETDVRAVALGDVDADGDADTVIAGGLSQVVVNTGLQPLPVRFTDPLSRGTANSPMSVVSGDIDADGDLDVVTAGYGESTGGVGIHRGDGAGTLGPATVIPASQGELLLGDLDADGDLDLLSYGYRTVRTLTNDGAGFFTETAALDTGAFSTLGGVLGDLDEDGILDLIASTEHPYAQRSFLGVGDGSFTPGQQLSERSFSSPLLADLDGDGHLDLAVTSDGLVIRYGDGTGSFPRRASFPGGGSGDLLLGDVTSDGIPDLVTAGSVNIGDGRGGFPVQRRGGTDATFVTALADLDGDGRLDRVGLGAGNLFTYTVAYVELGLGDGRFRPAQYVPAGGRPRAMVTPDLNEDGRPDLVTVSPGGDAVNVALNTSTATPRDLLVLGVRPATTVVAPGGKLTVTDTVLNGGDAAAGPSRTSYRLSPTGALAGARPVPGGRTVPALPAGAFSDGSGQLSVPPTIAAGDYSVVVCADAAGVVAENDERNNCALSAFKVHVGPGGPDLTAVIVLYSRTVAAGAEIDLNGGARNDGNAVALESSTGFRLSGDRQPGGDITLTGTADLPILRPGDVRSRSASALVPPGTAPGSYYVLACADAGQTVPETDETDNCTASSTRVQIAA